MKTLNFLILFFVIVNTSLVKAAVPGAKSVAVTKKCISAVEELAVINKGDAKNASSIEQIAKFEIAQLLLERSKLKGDSDAPLRTLLDKNIRQKVGEFKDRFGKELDANEIKTIITEIESGQLKQTITKKHVEKQARARESRSLTVTKRYFLEDLGSLHTLDDMYFGDTDRSNMKSHNITGGGVQWCADEKYVVFRNFEKKTRIYNTEAKKFIGYEPATGIISKGGGHVFAENDQDQTTIHDLDTNQQWGPIKGNPFSDFLSDDFIITRYEVPSPGTSLKDQYHVLYDYRHDRKIDLGREFTMSSDRKLVVRNKTKNKIEVVEVATGTVVKTFNIDAKQRDLSWWPGGYFTFKKNDKIHFVSLENLNDVEIPFDQEPFKVSGDGLKLLFKINAKLRNDLTIVVYDVSTGKQFSIKGYDDARLSPDSMKVLIYRYMSKKTVMVDFKTLGKRDLPGFYEHWTANGRWVYRSDSDGQWYDHKIYDLVGDKPLSVRSGFDFDFIGQTDFLMIETPYLPPSKEITKTFVNDLTQYNGNPFSLQIGETAAKPSPSGKFILTYKDGKVELSEFIAK